ncbi:glycosyltransferase [Skermanella rosea]|uniref:glycosyltransferase n=1 Tax=Skermanella rosea TaxID=1817965 RepID=UPI0019330A94|nr:glycosyltransferase [Skermanella rosea]UEM01641.1 glycosyltransferase [Skermanella rosea]
MSILPTGSPAVDTRTPPRRTILSLTLMAAVIAGTAMTHLGIWRGQTAPVDVAASPSRLQSVSYSPSGRDFSPEDDQHVSVADIRKDMAAINGIADGIRTYTVSDGQDRAPGVAARMGLKVSLGIWLNADAEHNRQEIDQAVAIARSTPNVVRVVVGNESLLRADQTDESLAALVAEVRARVPRRIPVGTADTWSELLNAPKTVAVSDFVGIHTLPYWEKLDSSGALPYALDKIKRIRQAYPGKPIWVGEIGWPSDGDNFGNAHASRPEQARIIREFAQDAKRMGVEYNVIEAFDQPWKTAIEGSPGPFWGVLDADRQPKWQLQGAVEPKPEAYAVGVASVLVGVFLSLPALFRRRATVLQTLLWSIAAHGSAGMTAWAVLAAMGVYPTMGTVIMWGSGLTLGGILLILALADLDEMTRTLLGRRPTRLLPAEGAAALIRNAGVAVREPMVSVHIAARNEDPAMLNATLDSLAAQEYGAFEVVVAINNTDDMGLITPVEDHCRTLNERLGRTVFKFANFNPITGFKAGALNRALRITADEAEVIAVLDADYAVSPQWLSRLAPAFSDPAVGLVQAPQEHRDGDQSLLKRLMAAEYRAFFDSGMVERNEDNALIAHGTMIMVRRSALEDLGGWSEWCIVEDTELGLTLLEQGWKQHYTTERLGAGITPDSYKDFRQQRHRWAYGSVQIMKAHLRALLPGAKGLNGAQKLHFWTGWARWWSDALGLIAGAGAITWTLLATVLPLHLPPPEVTAIAIAALMLRAAASMALTKFASRHGWGETVGTALLGMSLNYTVGAAVLKGLFTKHEPFKVTSKGKRKKAAKFPAVPEAVLAGLLVVCCLIATVLNHAGTVSLTLWTILLAVMAVPNLIAALLAATDLMPVRERAADAMPEPVAVPLAASQPAGALVADAAGG